MDTSLRLRHVIRRTIEGDGPGVGVEHGVRRALITVPWLPDAPGGIVTQVLTAPAHVVSIAVADAVGIREAILFDDRGYEIARMTTT